MDDRELQQRFDTIQKGVEAIITKLYEKELKEETTQKEEKTEEELEDELEELDEKPRKLNIRPIEDDN